TKAVTQMDEVTQQNAALVEEAAAAAESLEEQARSLVQSVGMFRLAGAAEGGAKAPAMLPGPALRDATPKQIASRKPPTLSGTAGSRKIAPPHLSDREDEWEEF
ncbi:MAG: hypothetical protein Q8O34_01255, partial [Rhodocyclaceae bacterium]|nr:hypothetical protein [Rhodocyclaceae bacterium]